MPGYVADYLNTQDVERAERAELMKPFEEGEQQRLTESIMTAYNLKGDEEVREGLLRYEPSELRMEHPSRSHEGGDDNEAERGSAYRIKAW